MKELPSQPFELIRDDRQYRLLEKFAGLRHHSEMKVNVLPRTLLEKEQNERSEIAGSKHEVTAELPYTLKTIARDNGNIRRFSGKKIHKANDTHLFGGDDRQILFDTSYPWRCIGKIFWTDKKGINHWGSASLIGATYVITAAHVLPINDLNYYIQFVPNDFNGQPQVGKTCGVTEIAYWEAVEDDVCGYDMVICKLSEPLGNELGYFGSRRYDDDWEDGNYWYHVGYPYDLGNGQIPYWQGPLSVVDDDSDSYGSTEVETYADIASGQSGGPLIGFWNGDPRIIGVLSGWEEEFSYSFPFSFTKEHAVFAGGSALTKLVHWGRENWS